MARSAQFQKIQVNANSNEMLEQALKEAEEVLEFNSYYGINIALMKRYIVLEHREELELLSDWYNTEKADIDFVHLMAGTKDPENDPEQVTLNLSALLKSIADNKEECSIAYLQKLQGALHLKLQHDNTGIGLRMETNSLFAKTEETEVHQPLDADSKEWLDELLKMANAKDIHPLIRASYFYYYFNVLKPFESNNELLAYLVCKRIIAGKLDIFGLVNIEKHVLRDKKFMTISKKFHELPDYKDRLAADLNEYTDAFISGYRQSIKAIRQSATDCVREQLDYKNLTPRQKNSLNFWLEKAFFLHREKLGQLSPRQHEMMLLIAKYGSLSNKDLVPVFMVDRKTIQRDFNALLDLKLLDQRGGGRALKYYINLRVDLGQPQGGVEVHLGLE
jgi:Fic family protein